MAIMRIVLWPLCWIGLHSWKHLPDCLGGCGMGLEWFENWECRRCLTTYDHVRGGHMKLTIRNIARRKP